MTKSKFELKYARFTNSILEYWCIVQDGIVLFYFMSQSEAIKKIEELENGN